MNTKFYKICVVGDLGTGKTSILKRAIDGRFDLKYNSTIGVDFKLATVKSVKLQFWDIAGAERFGNMLKIYYQDTAGFFLVCDVTRPSTIQGLQKWNNTIVQQFGENIPRVVLINKIDLPDEYEPDKYVSYEQEVSALCTKMGIETIFRVSSRNGGGDFDGLFERMLSLVSAYEGTINLNDQRPLVIPEPAKNFSQIIQYHVDQFTNQIKTFITSLKSPPEKAIVADQPNSIMPDCIQQICDILEYSYVKHDHKFLKLCMYMTTNDFSKVPEGVKHHLDEIETILISDDDDPTMIVNEVARYILKHKKTLKDNHC